MREFYLLGVVFPNREMKYLNFLFNQENVFSVNRTVIVMSLIRLVFYQEIKGTEDKANKWSEYKIRGDLFIFVNL